LHGLDGLEDRDTVTGQQHCQQEEEILSISTEIDRVYADVVAVVGVEQPDQFVHIRQSGFNDVVVWNPGEGVQ
jgi:D-hexose-6-phosphate mutarotase